MKYLVVTGGTMSGLGKGTAISSIGCILKSEGLVVTAIKIDPYLNVDAGTMSPFEHGEVYVLSDGGEVDLDLGNYERFLNIELTKDHNITSGKIFHNVIQKEREGRFLGKTVQLVPHVTAEIEEWINRVSTKIIDPHNQQADICLIEVGGTVGDIESSMYLQALQLLQQKVGNENFCVCHLTYVPVIGDSREQKSKPTQHSVKDLLLSGLRADFILCRCEDKVSDMIKSKIHMFTQTDVKNVISLHNVDNIYSVPSILKNQNFANLIMERLHIESKNPIIPLVFDQLSYRLNQATNSVNIGIVGKYTKSCDTYLSVVKALNHSAIESNYKLNIFWIESSLLEENDQKAWETVKMAEGILCPGGFGDRGIEGKIQLAHHCRVLKKPYLGICLGLQCSVIEFTRNVLNLADANSTEFNPSTPHPVVIAMPEHTNELYMGGTMRLGARETVITPNTLAEKLYDNNLKVYERHRHRYEINPIYHNDLQKHGFVFSGKGDSNTRMQIAELKNHYTQNSYNNENISNSVNIVNHPFYFCTQFHPEFTSRPQKPSPPFLGLILAAKNQLLQRLSETTPPSLRPGHVYLTN